MLMIPDNYVKPLGRFRVKTNVGGTQGPSTGVQCDDNNLEISGKCIGKQDRMEITPNLSSLGL